MKLQQSPTQARPKTLALLSLPGVIMLPGSTLSLRVSERAHLYAMRDAERNGGLVGLVQPSNKASPPKLHAVGCAGYICKAKKHHGDCLEVKLTGVARFGIIKEIASICGYRQAQVDWDTFNDDGADKASRAVIETFITQVKKCDFTQELVLQGKSIHEMVSNVISDLPLPDTLKQKILETPQFDIQVGMLSELLRVHHAARCRAY